MFQIPTQEKHEQAECGGEQEVTQPLPQTVGPFIGANDAWFVQVQPVLCYRY